MQGSAVDQEVLNKGKLIMHKLPIISKHSSLFCFLEICHCHSGISHSIKLRPISGSMIKSMFSMWATVHNRWCCHLRPVNSGFLLEQELAMPSIPHLLSPKTYSCVALHVNFHFPFTNHSSTSTLTHCLKVQRSSRWSQGGWRGGFSGVPNLTPIIIGRLFH